MTAQILFIVVRLVLKKGGTLHYVGFVMTSFLSVVCYMGLNSSLSPAYSSSGDLIYAGADLNSGGFVEYYRDVVTLCMFALVVGSFTNYAWYIFMLIPLYGVILAWKYIIGPWINAPSQHEVPEDEATRKWREKKERQAARKQKFAARMG
jgi:hypothetical protein